MAGNSSAPDGYFAQLDRPWWQPYISLLMTLYGIFFLGWSLQPVIMIFWFEVIYMVGFAWVRTFLALDGRPISDTIGLKIMLLSGGALMGICFIMFAVAFTHQGFEIGNGNVFTPINIQVNIMGLSYLVSFLVHYLLSGYYKIASPIEEMGRTLIHLLVLLAVLQAFTMHLIPAHPEWRQELWVGVALVGVKFAIDLVASKVGTNLAKQKETVQRSGSAE